MRNDCLILDGGLATELERVGHDLDHPLWSAKLMLEDRDAVRMVHRSYLEAGADCLITASYQVSYSGCKSLGMTEDETTGLLEDTVRIAKDSVKEFCLSDSNFSTHSKMVIASIGPYGAYLADGSEYRGDYGITNNELRSFHGKRFKVLTATDADILVCETIPSFNEAEVLLELLESAPGRNAWFSFSCRDDEHINDGTLISECASMLSKSKQVAAIGVNCTAPQYVSGLIRNIRKTAPSKPVVVYPNAGESYDADSGSWVADPGKDPGSSKVHSIDESAREWYALGARIIGGCCRTGPEDIRKIRNSLYRIKDDG